MGNEGLNPGVEIGSTEGVEQDIAIPEPQTQESETDTSQEIIEHRSEPVGEAPEIGKAAPITEKGITSEDVIRPTIDSMFDGSANNNPSGSEETMRNMFEDSSKNAA